VSLAIGIWLPAGDYQIQFSAALLAYITGTLSEYFNFVPFWPEAAAGLGIPRQPIRSGEQMSPGMQLRPPL